MGKREVDIIDLFSYSACTGIQEVALLRSKLESLHLDATDRKDQQLTDQLKICCGMCQLAYHKLGEEQCRYEENLEQLKVQKEQLHQMLKDVTEQGTVTIIIIAGKYSG